MRNVKYINVSAMKTLLIFVKKLRHLTNVKTSTIMYIYLCCKSCILNFNDGPYKMKQLAFIGYIVKGFFFFDGNIYAKINMSQVNGIIPLKLYSASDPEIRVRMHQRL